MELVLRAQHNDHEAVADLLCNPSALPARHRRYLRRVVVDATAAAGTDKFAAATADSNTRLLVDPMTFLLTSQQAEGDSWASLPFATAGAVPADALRDPVLRATLVREVVEFQFDLKATDIIPPYLNIERLDGPVVDLQMMLLAETHEYVARTGIQTPIFPVISATQSSVRLDPTLWSAGLGRLIGRANAVAPGGFGLALSASSSAINGRNLSRAAQIWTRASRMGPVFAWHAGKTGLLAVTLGAAGYEVGMGSGELWNTSGAQRTRRPKPEPVAGKDDKGGRYFGVYVDVLQHSLDRGAVEKLAKHRELETILNCFDPSCCGDGYQSMINGQRRQHAVRNRVADMATLDKVGSPAWRLHQLERKAAEAEAAAARIRSVADRFGIQVGARPEGFSAMRAVTTHLRDSIASVTA